jgi:hypothetical protein
MCYDCNRSAERCLHIFASFKSARGHWAEQTHFADTMRFHSLSQLRQYDGRQHVNISGDE